jgi:glyceraldehyde 3-phosphate dehydrogenase
VRELYDELHHAGRRDHGRRIGVAKAIMTTVHAYTASQALVDGPDKHVRRGRAGAANFLPTSTGAALATTKALRHFAGLFDGVAVRGPVPAGSLADIVLLTTRPTTVDEVNSVFKEEADSERYRGILGVTESTQAIVCSTISAAAQPKAAFAITRKSTSTRCPLWQCG